MRILVSFIFCVFMFCACHDSGPNTCFTVQNPTMALGDTVKLKICGSITTESTWDMGDTIYPTGKTPKHVYKARGTYIIKLTSTELMGAGKKIFHWKKPAVSETQKTVTVQ